MAKPDLDHGFVQLAYELDAALCFAGFTGDAQTMLRYVRAQTFGVRKAKVAYLPQSVLAARIGKPRQVVARAIKELMEAGVLVRVRDDQYKFIKDYESWTRNNKPRLTPREVADCMLASDYAKAFDLGKHADESVIKSDDTEAKTNGSLSSDALTRRHQMRLQTVIKSDDKIVPPYVPPSRNGELELENTPDAGVPDALRSEPNPEPTYPADVDPQAPNMITPAERAELDRVAALCDLYFPMLDQIKRVVSGREGAYPVWAYAPAVEELRKMPRPKHRRDYFIGIVGRVAAEGPEAAKAILAATRASPKIAPTPAYRTTSPERRKEILESNLE